MTAPQRPASNSDARKRAGEKATHAPDPTICVYRKEPRPDGMEGCHNDGNPANNRVENLRWDTHSANMLDRTQHGTCPNANKTHCPANHPYDETNTVVSGGKRNCRICRRAAGRRHDQKRRGRKRVAA